MKKYTLPHRLRESILPIHYIYGDKQNRTWILTSKGICYSDNEADSLQMLYRENRPVRGTAICCDGDYLAIPVIDSLLIYNENLQLTRAIPFGKAKTGIAQILPYDAQHYLVITYQSKMNLLDKQTGEMKASPFGPTAYYAYKDTSGSYWISYYLEGVRHYHQDGRLLAAYHTGNSNLSNDIVLDIKEWNGSIWLATDGGGVNIIYPDTDEIQVLSNREHQFPANSVGCLYRGNNYMWIGMVREGVLGVTKGFITTYTKSTSGSSSGLSEKCPLYLWEDTDGSLWIGTDGGGINRFDPRTERFTHYPETAGEKIVSICPLSPSELLLSSYSKGIFRFNKKTGHYRRMQFPGKIDEEKMSRMPVNLLTNEKGEIDLYGSLRYRYSPLRKKLTPIHSTAGFNVPWIYIGQHDSLLFFHDQSNLIRYNTRTEHYHRLPYKERTQIFTAAIDTAGTLWVSDSEGMSRYSPFTNQRETIELPDKNDLVTSIVSAPDGTIWMGVLGMLYAYDPEKNHFVMYGTMDGVLSNDFLAKPVLTASDGSIYMGGSEGLLRINKRLKASIATSITVSLKLQKVLLDGTTIPFSGLSGLKIASDFSSLDIHVLPNGSDVFRKRIFRFRIKGLNNSYIETSRSHLTLPTLRPGDYEVTAQCTQNDGHWSPEFPLLSFTVLPPWWGQTWFIAMCIGILLILSFYLMRQHDKKLQYKVQEQERNIYKDKVRTLININHELRTPLTLIYTPLKQLIGSKQLPYELKDKLLSAFKQARQMRNIIDMVLNLRKMEVEQDILHMSSVNFNEWLQGIMEDFRYEFLMRGITLEFVPDREIESMYFDCNQCEIIINNLLSNAYKFSEPNSAITVSTRLDKESNHVRVIVQDQGIGLQGENPADLFNRFYQGNHGFQGSGIGLSYAKQLVEMHGGVIGARNNEDRGACFFFTLPYRQERASIRSTPQVQLNNILPDESVISRKQETLESVSKFHSILIVEDDPDLCSFLVCNLQASFEKVYEAHDGREALPIITSRLPQIVVCDVKMPRMNGLELCRYIKQKSDLSYIPVVLLTSYVDNEAMEEGYKAGAEAYIGKPFDMDLLIIQIHNILQRHNVIKKHYSTTLEIPRQLREESDPTHEHLMLQLNRIISENIGNANLDVSFITRQMGMSRTSLYNKVKEASGIKINEYIIKCRMEYATRLLETTSLSVGEIAEQSGFQYPRNFSTLFKANTGQSPSDYRKNIRSGL